MSMYAYFYTIHNNWGEINSFQDHSFFPRADGSKERIKIRGASSHTLLIIKDKDGDTWAIPDFWSHRPCNSLATQVRSKPYEATGIGWAYRPTKHQRNVQKLGVDGWWFQDPEKCGWRPRSKSRENRVHTWVLPLISCDNTAFHVLREHCLVRF